MKNNTHATPSHLQRRQIVRAFAAAGIATGLLGLSACENLHPAIQLGIAVMLISKAEVDQVKDNLSESIVIPLSGDEPIIDIVQPSVQGGKVGSPMVIEVRFKPAAGKKIDPASFKLYYGAFKLDVTQRLLKSAKVTADGFSISNVEIPAGEHRLVLRVSDDTGASGIRELRVKVEG
jgi:hypothetical protein